MATRKKAVKKTVRKRVGRATGTSSHGPVRATRRDVFVHHIDVRRWKTAVAAATFILREGFKNVGGDGDRVRAVVSWFFREMGRGVPLIRLDVEILIGRFIEKMTAVNAPASRVEHEALTTAVGVLLLV